MLKKVELLDILKEFSFEVYQHNDLGPLVKLSPEDAFLFSAIVGSNYLVEPVGITMKGRSEVFIHRSIFQEGHFIYSPGLFERDKEGFLTEGNSSSFLLKKYPSIFSGNKYLLIKEISLNQVSNIEYETYNQVLDTDIKPEDILLLKLKDSGSTLEPLYEYFTSLEFIRKGYLVENQVPWFQQNYKYKNSTIHGGIPDFSAFHSTVSTYLNRNGIIQTNKGVHLSLLPVIRNFRKIEGKKDSPEYQYELILGEVKSSKASLPQALNQLNKYSSVDLANKLFTMIPSVVDNKSSQFGEIYIHENKIRINEKFNFNINEDAQMEDNKWINTYVKMLLLGNLDIDAVYELITKSRVISGQEIYKKYQATHLIDAVINIPDEEFFASLRERK